MKKLLACIFSASSIVFYTNLLAQQPLSIEWQKCFGGSNEEFATSVAESYDHTQYVFAGLSLSTDGDLSCNSGHTAWVASMNQSGILWQQCLGSQWIANQASRIIRTSDGGYAICGSIGSQDGFFFGYHGGSDAWVTKLDAYGNILWAKCFGGSGHDGGSSIIETNDEGRDLVLVGSTNSIDGDVSGWHADTSVNKNDDVWIVRMSSKGIIKWQKCLGGTGDDYGASIIQTSDGGFVIAATSASNDGDVIGNHLDSNKKPTKDFWIVKLDHDGNIQWQKSFGGSRNEEPLSIIQTLDGGYAIAGVTNSNDGDIIGYHKSLDLILSNDNEWIVKLNSSGTLEWQKCLGGGLQATAYSIVQLSDTGYIVVGQTNSNDGDVSGNHGNYDVWLAKINKIGAIKWQQCYGGSGDEGTGNLEGNPFIKTSDGGYLLAWSTSSNDGDVAGGGYHGFGDVWLVKFSPDSDKASVETSEDIARNSIELYPNPSSNEIHLNSSTNLTFRSISFYDVMGRQHFPNFTLENNSITCDVHELTSGVYLARLGWIGNLTWRSNYPGTFTLPFIVQH